MVYVLGRVRVGVFTALLACILAAPSSAQPRPAALGNDELEAVVRPWALQMGGTTAFALGCGSDVSSCGDAALLRSMPYASITKQFVAALVLSLRDQGKLKLSDRLAQYGFSIPGDQDITLESLLTHTSGLADFVPGGPYMSGAGSPVAWEDMLAMMRSRQSAFPGIRGKFAYSNMNYVLLGRVCGEAGGAPLSSLAAKYIFDPLGLKCTISSQPMLHESWGGGAGAAHGSAEDLARWGLALAARSEKVLPSGSWDDMTRPRVPASPLPDLLTLFGVRSAPMYGYGVMSGDLGMYRTTYYHTGILPVGHGTAGRFSFVGAESTGVSPRSFVVFTDRPMEGAAMNALAGALTAAFAASEAKGWTEWMLSGPDASEVEDLVRRNLLSSGIALGMTQALPALRARVGSLHKFTVVQQEARPTFARFRVTLEGSAGSVNAQIMLARGGSLQEYLYW